MSQKRQILHYLLAYLLWILSVSLGIFTLNLVRETVLLAMVVSSSAGNLSKSELFYRSLQAGAAAQWSIVLVGLFALILLVALEHLYRTGATSGELWKSFFLVTGIECAVLFVVNTAYFILQANYLPLRWWFFAIPATEALLMGLFLWLRFSSTKTPKFSRL